MIVKTVELNPQAPQATTDLHRIALGLESGLSDQCVYSLCCLDTCICEGLVNPVKDEGLWNKCEISLLKLLHSSASGPLLLHVLNTLSLTLQMSDPESDALVPRLVDILLGSGKFTVKERILALKCMSVLELDESETALLTQALVLILRFAVVEPEHDLIALAVSHLCRYVSETNPKTINDTLIPNILKILRVSENGSKLMLSCIGYIHILLETRPDAVSSDSVPEIASTFVERLNGGCNCSVACETCQGCLSCILRIGVHPVLRECLRPFVNTLIRISFDWKSGSPVAAQSLLSMMAGLLH
jgi:hypothetical protein